MIHPPFRENDDEDIALRRDVPSARPGRGSTRQEQQQKPAKAPKQEEPIQGPTFRTGIDLVAVDVAVVDRRGRPVEDLRAPEFSVKIDGEVRRVVSAELIKVDVEAARKAGCRQDRELLHEQPDAAERAADHHRCRPGQHPARIASPGPRRRRPLSRSPEPTRSGGVRCVPRARAARELHQRQAAPATSDAGAGRTAAASQGRHLQHRRVGSDFDRRAPRSDRPRGSDHPGVPQLGSATDRAVRTRHHLRVVADCPELA